MKTRINLYLPQLRPVKEILSLKQSVSYMITSVLLVFISIGALNYLDDMSTQARVGLQSELSIEEQILADKAKELAAVTTTTPLLKDIEQVKVKIAEKKKVLSVLKTEFADNIGFSVLFEGLTQLAMNNVWLTRIESKAGKLSFGGSALKSKNIPKWVKTLESSAAFSGHSFSNLDITREDSVVHFTLYNDDSFVTQDGR